VSYEVPVIEPGQLVLYNQGLAVAYTASGRATGTTSIGLTTLVHMSGGEQLSLRAALSNPSAIEITANVAQGPGYSTLLIELVKAD